jgi:hypothetical protein
MGQPIGGRPRWLPVDETRAGGSIRRHPFPAHRWWRNQMRSRRRTDMPVIEVDNLYKRYGDQVAVDDL